MSVRIAERMNRMKPSGIRKVNEKGIGHGAGGREGHPLRDRPSGLRYAGLYQTGGLQGVGGGQSSLHVELWPYGTALRHCRQTQTGKQHHISANRNTCHCRSVRSSFCCAGHSAERRG